MKNMDVKGFTKIDLEYYIKMFRENTQLQSDINLVSDMLPIWKEDCPEKSKILEDLLDRRFLSK
jgi:hypothetical protein